MQWERKSLTDTRWQVARRTFLLFILNCIILEISNLENDFLLSTQRVSSLNIQEYFCHWFFYSQIFFLSRKSVHAVDVNPIAKIIIPERPFWARSVLKNGWKNAGRVEIPFFLFSALCRSYGHGIFKQEMFLI